jgi:hypothetical protein
MTEVEGVDARLARRVECEVAALKTAIGKLKADGSGSTTVVARLSRLLAVLLGFDWHLGKPNRQLRYSQNRAEIAIDDTRSSSQGSSQHFLGIEQKRSVAIAKAHDDGLRILEIALVFNVSEQFVTDTLRRAGKIT